MKIEKGNDGGINRIEERKGEKGRQMRERRGKEGVNKWEKRGEGR